MLTEDQVVDVTRQWLELQGWAIKSFCHGTSQGDDIFAVSAFGKSLAVECKGGLSPNTMQPFHNNYVWKCISGALFNTARNVERSSPDQLHAMAFPNTRDFRAMTDVLKNFYERNNIHVFWVEPQGIAEVWQPANLFKASS